MDEWQAVNASERRDERREMILGMREDKWRVFVDEQLRAGSVQFEAHQNALQENTEITKRSADLLAAIAKAFELTKSGAHFLSVIGRWLHRFARWAAPILTMLGIIWAIFHGKWPDGRE